MSASAWKLLRPVFNQRFLPVLGLGLGLGTGLGMGLMGDFLEEKKVRTDSSFPPASGGQAPSMPSIFKVSSLSTPSTGETSLAEDSERKQLEFGSDEKPLKYWTTVEVQKAIKEERKLLVSYGAYLFDITDFLDKHPGGSEVLKKANGQDVQRLWQEKYTHHLGEHSQAPKFLKKYCVGQLFQALPAADPARFGNEDAIDFEEYGEHSPYNYEPRDIFFDKERGMSSPIFRRNRGEPKGASGILKISQLDESGAVKGSLSREISQEELEALPLVNESLPLICGGAKRARHPGKNPSRAPWGKWTDAVGVLPGRGVLLKDLLPELFGEEKPEFLLEAKGADGYSITLHSSQLSAALIAVSLADGSPFPEEHGGPRRLIIPLTPAFMSPKWVESLIIKPVPSPKFVEEKLIELHGSALPHLPWVAPVLLVSSPRYTDYILGDKKKNVLDIPLSLPLGTILYRIRERTKITESGEIREKVAHGFAFSGERPIRSVEIVCRDKENKETLVMAELHTPLYGDGRFVVVEAVLPEGTVSVNPIAQDESGKREGEAEALLREDPSDDNGNSVYGWGIAGIFYQVREDGSTGTEASKEKPETLTP